MNHFGSCLMVKNVTYLRYIWIRYLFHRYFWVIFAIRPELEIGGQTVRNGPVRQTSVNSISGQKNPKNVTSDRKLTRQNSVSITDFLSRVDEQVFRAMKKIASVFYELGQFSNWCFQLSLWLAHFLRRFDWLSVSSDKHQFENFS